MQKDATGLQFPSLHRKQVIVVETLGEGGGSNNLQNICKIKLFY